MRGIRRCPERRFSPRRGLKDAVAVVEQSCGDQPFSGRVLGGAIEGVAGAFLPRAGERAVQDRSSGEVERLAVVAQAAGDLAVVDEPRSRPKRVAVVSEAGQDLAGVREARFESLQRVDGSVERPSQAGRELLRGARRLDAREQRLDGAVIGGAVHVEVVDRAASGIAGGIGVFARGECTIDALV
jgi:hypothetical protein